MPAKKIDISKVLENPRITHLLGFSIDGEDKDIVELACHRFERSLEHVPSWIGPKNLYGLLLRTGTDGLTGRLDKILTNPEYKGLDISYYLFEYNDNNRKNVKFKTND